MIGDKPELWVAGDMFASSCNHFVVERKPYGINEILSKHRSRKKAIEAAKSVTDVAGLIVWSVNGRNEAEDAMELEYTLVAKK